MIVVVAEKPAVARDLAKVLGAKKRRQGFLEGSGYAVTWAIGHLVGLAQPHEMDPSWKRWQRSTLPMLPTDWKLVVHKKTRDQFKTVEKLLRQADVEEVICATDAGREGELIFRYIYQASRCRKPVRRLWISSLTESAIRKGFSKLREGESFEPLADAARGRSQADWLVGMNLSRACTLAFSASRDETFSVGRVQTPTLAMVVERELEIQAFVPEDYLEVEVIFELNAAKKGSEARAPDLYKGVYFRGEKPSLENRRLQPDGEEARNIVERANQGTAEITSITAQKKRLAPPLLYDLTELQRHANRLFGFSAKRTLGIAQKLYEQRKLITYPRTDSRYLTQDVAANLPQVVQAIQKPYRDLLAEGTGERPLGSRFVNDSKVGDHHAILPTPTSAQGMKLSAEENKIYDLICRRLLSAWHPDHLYSITRVITEISTESGKGSQEKTIVDRYFSRGKAIEQEGWKILDLKTTSKKKTKKSKKTPESEQGPPDQALPAGLVTGLKPMVADTQILEKQTRPPKRFTEATLLTAMETAGKTLDDKELSAAMRESGLGTPATRAETIETLLRREYIERERKSLVATDKGIRLIRLVDPRVKSPSMTGEWEARLKRIERGEAKLAPFMSEIENYVREVVGGTFGEPETTRGPVPESVRSEKLRMDSSRSPSNEPPDFWQSPPPEAFETDPQEPPDFFQAPPEDDPFWQATLPSNPTEPSNPTAPSNPVARTERLKARPTPDGSPGESASRSRQPASPYAYQTRLFSEPEKQTTPKIDPFWRKQTTPVDELGNLLRGPFQLIDFRPHQEDVCRAVTSGENVLLVMPTGAGKSLCYQLPGLARSGTTLVISPLIALMEDQVTKLQQLGLVAERIHSGRSRSDLRWVCKKYLDGELDFLFIAPERLSVPGFPEMLARCKPTLVAVDEAHCISQWGHDFRPDYRLLNQRLPLLSPAPIIALTATATPIVQNDIVHQLGVDQATRFIHGFRRTNIAVEVVEARPSERQGIVERLLEEEANRPAIVYAPTRKQANALGDALSTLFPAASYHAGMTTFDRDRVQSAFLSGGLEVIVATIAFGMGVDKPNIRTVIHTGLPGTLEGYYQEIGRAGRDGLPSRAILLYSYADRRTHEFFHSRDYPEVDILSSIFKHLSPDPLPLSRLIDRLGYDPEVVHKALEKLWIHGGALVDPEDNVRRGDAGWRAPYTEQRKHKLAQLAQITRYAQQKSCRMLQLVRHFGDQEDSGEVCGLCDICHPQGSSVRQFRAAEKYEIRLAQRIFDALQDWDGQGTGKLFKETCNEGRLQPREVFDRVLSALASAELLRIADDSFQKSGRTIHFQRAFLTSTSQFSNSELESALLIPDTPTKPGGSRRSPRKGAKKSKRKVPGTSKSSTSKGSTAKSNSVQNRSSKSTGGKVPGTSRSKRKTVSKKNGPPSPKLIQTLKEWRLREAKKRRIPAFYIMPDKTIEALAADRPHDEATLLEVKGVGPSVARKYGSALLKILTKE